MTITSNIIESILKLSGGDAVSERAEERVNAPRALSEDVVTISEEGRKRIMERLKHDVVEHLGSKK
ncbi:MAG: hypothetical protein HY890_02510 [Deltaproteobacteria bacterium]|nr:hypothetical protein [Deltaproteobacteria bacterium]